MEPELVVNWKTDQFREFHLPLDRSWLRGSTQHVLNKTGSLFTTSPLPGFRSTDKAEEASELMQP